MVLSFDHQLCSHILVTSWQHREGMCHFSRENVVPIKPWSNGPASSRKWTQVELA